MKRNLNYSVNPPQKAVKIYLFVIPGERREEESVTQRSHAEQGRFFTDVQNNNTKNQRLTPQSFHIDLGALLLLIPSKFVEPRKGNVALIPIHVRLIALKSPSQACRHI